MRTQTLPAATFLIALVLGGVGAVAHLAGPLLWPAVELHGAVALALVLAS